MRFISRILFCLIAGFWSGSAVITGSVFAQELNGTKKIAPSNYAAPLDVKNQSELFVQQGSIGLVANTEVLNFEKKELLQLLPIWPYRTGIDCQFKKCLALTFDDGPGDLTGQLLDILKSKQINSTFFVLGLQIPGREDVLRRMIDEGHEIGNHSYGHKSFKRISTQQISDEINITQNMIEGATGYRPHIVRPPMGEANSGEPALASYPIINWNVDPSDWKNRNSNVIRQEILNQVKPGSIVLMHDIYPTSINAVAQLTDELKAQGYEFVTISELMGWPNPQAVSGFGQIIRGL